MLMSSQFFVIATFEFQLLNFLPIVFIKSSVQHRYIGKFNLLYADGSSSYILTSIYALLKLTSCMLVITMSLQNEAIDSEIVGVTGCLVSCVIASNMH